MNKKQKALVILQSLSTPELKKIKDCIEYSGLTDCWLYKEITKLAIDKGLKI